MTNSKKKTGENINVTAENSEVVSKPLTKEEGIKKACEQFVIERRKEFEQTVKVQAEALEKRLRDETPVYRFTDKSYDISLVLISSRFKEQPIFGFSIGVEGSFNEFAWGQKLQEEILNYFKGDKFRDTQNNLYYRFKTQGMKPTEIYPQIEPRYSTMDSKEKRNFRSRLRENYVRRKAKQKDNENGEILSSSK